MIVLPPPTANGVGSNGTNSGQHDIENVHFIDYEYATPSPAAFDIANHFAEWGGYDCDYNMMPTRSVRKEFLTQYIESYYTHHSSCNDVALERRKEIVDKLYRDVDRFRGIPGFYWYLTLDCLMRVFFSSSTLKLMLFMIGAYGHSSKPPSLKSTLITLLTLRSAWANTGPGVAKKMAVARPPAKRCHCENEDGRRKPKSCDSTFAFI